MPINLDRTCQEQYGVDFTQRMREILPFFFEFSIQTGIQKTRWINLAEVLFNAFQKSNVDFIALCEFIRDRLAFTGQVLSLNELLNIKFDPVQERIFILCLANNFVEGIDIYNNDEVDPTPIILYINFESAVAPITLWTNDEIFDPDSLFGKNFVVRVPNDVPTSDDLITALLNLYVIAPQNYIIQRF